ncbi:hypothetical protein EDB84DRAFT_1241668, partial [Lactarius hengduanensis]
TFHNANHQLIQFIAMCLRQIKGHPCGYQLRLLERHNAIGLDLWNALEKDNSQEAIIFLHQFFWQLCGTSTAELKEEWGDALQAFIAVSALSSSGTFKHARDITSDLARWKYLLRAMVLHQIISSKESFLDVFMINFLKITRACVQYCSQLLSEQNYSSFWNIADLQHLASAIAYSDALPPNIIWKEDLTELTYKSTRININQLRKGLHTINDEVHQLLVKLSGGILLPCKIPTDLDDDLTKDEAGHSFLNHPSLSHQHLSIVHHMIKDPSLNFISIQDHSNQLYFSQATMSFILTICAKINQLLMVLLHTVSSQPPRGTEEIDIRLWNGHRHRNIFLLFGQVWKIIQATKTENTIGHSTFIPAVLPPEVAQHLFYYLVHVRPLETFLSEKVYGASAKTLYQEFLYVQLGKQVTSDQFSHSMSQIMASQCGAAIGIRAWRHLAIALKREFIPPSLVDPFQNHQDVGDMAASHSTWTARKNYAIDQNSLPLLSTDAMLAHEAFCKCWHSVLHFGTLPPPIPMRQL